VIPWDPRFKGSRGRGRKGEREGRKGKGNERIGEGEEEEGDWGSPIHYFALKVTLALIIIVNDMS